VAQLGHHLANLQRDFDGMVDRFASFIHDKI
jgi:hypothetical protein